MKHEFTLEFWEDDGWFVGKLKEVPGVFSQGETLQDLEENIADAYKLMSRDDQAGNRPPARTKGIVLEVA
ncbi:type II toxin-antitoxin system HicB family antitoxin [Thiohalocapsa sp. ML1]|jgi:predicted RNase H-like HicB family nuclease|uniref:type II toxin-antitoxin system HicB family antitoxin n=1 Tax=Thiohalocapsa sp. ML1 TaxID=1431688 RepID=UPI0009E7F075|nr:type II toxin-antitoxin system HicB family antitoxin [Thiohalocapsa sp. ML1]